MDGSDRVEEVLASVKPLVAAQNFTAVCERLAAETTTAIAEDRDADAASLSNMLASFLSMTGDDQKALEALEHAEMLEPGSAHRAISTAEHLFARMHRKDAATAKARAVLTRTAGDLLARHEALALLGRIAVSEGRLEDACELLQQSFEVALSGDVEAAAWDRALPRLLTEVRACSEPTRAYLQELLRRADAESDSYTGSKTRKLLSML